MTGERDNGSGMMGEQDNGRVGRQENGTGELDDAKAGQWESWTMGQWDNLGANLFLLRQCWVAPGSVLIPINTLLRTNQLRLEPLLAKHLCLLTDHLKFCRGF